MSSIHVTRVAGGSVYGHDCGGIDANDPCSGLKELYYQALHSKDVEVGQVYDLTPDGHIVPNDQSIPSLIDDVIRLRAQLATARKNYLDLVDSVCRESSSVEDACAQARAIRADRDRGWESSEVWRERARQAAELLQAVRQSARTGWESARMLAVAYAAVTTEKAAVVALAALDADEPMKATGAPCRHGKTGECHDCLVDANA